MFRKIAAGTLLASATIIGGATAANAATSDDPATQAYYDQVEKDWSNSINAYLGNK